MSSICAVEGRLLNKLTYMLTIYGDEGAPRVVVESAVTLHFFLRAENVPGVRFYFHVAGDSGAWVAGVTVLSAIVYAVVLRVNCLLRIPERACGRDFTEGEQRGGGCRESERAKEERERGREREREPERERGRRDYVRLEREREREREREDSIHTLGSRPNLLKAGLYHCRPGFSALRQVWK
jgi:hypothetical protein